MVTISEYRAHSLMEQPFTKTHTGLEAGEATHALGTNLVTAGFFQSWSFFFHIRALGLCIRCGRIHPDGGRIIPSNGSVQIILLQLGELTVLVRAVVAVLNFTVVELTLGKSQAPYL